MASSFVGQGRAALERGARLFEGVGSVSASKPRRSEPAMQYRFTVSGQLHGMASALAERTLPGAGGNQPVAGARGPGEEYSDVNDIVELLVLAGRPIDEGAPLRERHRAESAKAAQLLGQFQADDVVTRASVQSHLPRHTVTVLRMGPVRASGAEAQERDSAFTARVEALARGGLSKSAARREADRAIAAERAAGAVVTDSPIELISETDIPFLRPHPAGQSDPQPMDDDGYLRTRMGMSLADSAAEVWSSARGYWRTAPDADYLVPSRYGWCPYVFKVEDWRELEGSNRIWASGGWLIDVERDKLVRLRESTGAQDQWLPGLEDDEERSPTPEDLRVARLLTRKLLTLGPRTPNPVLRLKRTPRKG